MDKEENLPHGGVTQRTSVFRERENQPEWKQVKKGERNTQWAVSLWENNPRWGSVVPPDAPLQP